MEIRMVPIGNIFNRYPRMVRDLSIKENKKLELLIEGQEIEFDRTVLDQIGDPIVHLLRNAVDHGIEPVEERLKTGKSETGTIKLIARREKNNAIIEISDDGGGIPIEKVKKKSIERGHITKEEAAKMTDDEACMLIFRPGNSTNDVVTEVSGRGVGMDVVISKTKELGGSVRLHSELGKGTTVTLQLPLTVAIITGLIVRANNERYAIPLNTVDETVNVFSDQIKTIQNNKVFVLRGMDIPLFWLHDLTGISKIGNNKKLTVVIVMNGTEKTGLVVDEILSQQQVLIKSLQDMVKGTKGCAGATILGDGGVALILDIASLLQT
jgi:two-component system, chemotaxis family, sensor kinase CheA